jgi:hypothetical protein
MEVHLLEVGQKVVVVVREILIWEAMVEEVGQREAVVVGAEAP